MKNYKFIKSKFLRLKRQNGFSLLEVMVAISIVTVGLGGAMALITMSFSAGAASTERLIAANLAQEGIEVVRNIRDINYSSDSVRWQNWYNSVSNGTYAVQFDSTTFILGNTYLSPLNFNAGNGRYSYDPRNSPSSFTRKIILTKAPAPDYNANEIKVECVVSWSEKGVAKSLIVEDRLWNWWR